jgi:hypothetical protein
VKELSEGGLIKSKVKESDIAVEDGGPESIWLYTKSSVGREHMKLSRSVSSEGMHMPVHPEERERCELEGDGGEYTIGDMVIVGCSVGGDSS